MKIVSRWMFKGGEESGQALVEFMFVAFILLFLLFGMIDFCRAISMRQVLINLSREGANEAARGFGDTVDATISNAIAAVIAGDNPLDLTSTNGLIIISAVSNINGTFRITNQLKKGGLTQSSKIGLLNATGNGAAGSGVTMPFLVSAQGTIPQSNQTTFVAEVYYNFKPVTSLGGALVGGLRGFSVTNQFYDVAYF
jgi:Flp pilus assembly protein TadG